MTNYKYLMALMTFIVVVVGQRFAGPRVKSKFRPSGNWFANMQGGGVGDGEVSALDTVIPSEDFEQSDQPYDDNFSFQDFYVEDFEPGGGESETKEGKFPRMASRKVDTFQNICPYINTTVFPGIQNPEFEYVPSHYQKITCAYPYQQHSRFAHDQRKNHVCHSDRGFNCVQMTSSIFLLKRRKDTDCWQPEIIRNVPTDCSCMWPKHLLGDYDRNMS